MKASVVVGSLWEGDVVWEAPQRGCDPTGLRCGFPLRRSTAEPNRQSHMIWIVGLHTLSTLSQMHRRRTSIGFSRAYRCTRNRRYRCQTN
jgi:hypothetical protein